MTSPQNMFSFDIGLVDGRQRLNCYINLHQKSYRYYKSRRVLLAFDPTSRLKKWAFGRLRRHSQPLQNLYEGAFLPGELFRGNLQIIPAFLQQLRSQKVESFIHLRLDKKREQEPCVKMLQRLAKILNDIKRDVFKKMLKSVSIHINMRKNQRHFTRKGQKVYETFVSRRTDHSNDSNPPGRSVRSLSITYTRINLSGQKEASRRTQPHSLQKSKNAPYPSVSIKRLQAKTPRKMYMLEPNMPNGSKRTPSKDSSSSQF